jgi:hypothetical protein
LLSSWPRFHGAFGFFLNREDTNALSLLQGV